MSYKDNNIQYNERLVRIKNNSELQLKIIQYFYPQVELKKKFKLHDEKIPSSSIKLDNGIYWLKNFSTSEKSKDWLAIAQSILACNVKEALDYICIDILHQPILTEKESIDEVYSSFDKRIFAIIQNSKTESESYLLSRAIAVVALPANSYYQSNNIDKTARGIVFIDSQKQLINTRNLDTEKGAYINTGVLDNSIYDALYKPDNESVYLVEGCINALSLTEHSSLAFFSASNNFTDFEKLHPYLSNKKVILAFDNDIAGNRFKEQMLDLIVEHELTDKPILQLCFPKDIDVNNLLLSNELQGFIEKADNYVQLYPKLIANSADEELDIQQKGFFKRNNAYYVGINGKGRTKEISISNFIMEVVYFFPDGTDNSKRIFFLQNKQGNTDLVSISTKSLTLDAFKYTIRSRGNYSFTGTTQNLDLILEDIFQHEKSASEISVLGYQPEHHLYAFANGLLIQNTFVKTNRHGVVETNGKSLYLPAFSLLNKYSNEYADEQKFQYRKGKLAFNVWSQKLIQAFDDKAIIGIAFIIGAVFREIIFKEQEFYPHLFLFGDAGVGKTTFAELLLCLFYKGYKGISLEGNSSSKSVARAGHKIRNGLLYLKEYDSKIEKSIIGLLKTGYEGVGYTRAQTTNDNKIHDTNINSAILIDGNTLPSESSAQFSRMIILNFKQSTFTEKQTIAFKELKENVEHGFGKVLIDILQHRNHFKVNFKSKFNEIYNHLKYEVNDLEHLSERSLRHTVLFLAIYRSIEAKLQLPFTYDELFETLTSIITEQNLELSSLNRVAQFWETLDFLKTKGLIKKGIHYKYATRTDGLEFLALKLNLLHKLYKENSNIVEGEIMSLADLLRLITIDPAFIQSWTNTRGNTVTVSGFSCAYAFDISKLTLNLTIWER